MGALVAILQNDSNLLRCRVQRLDRHVALAEASGAAPDGYGYGCYTSSQVLLSKRPSGFPTPLGLGQLAGEVDSEVLLAHARTATVGNHKDENTHPFRFRRWLFAHDGTVEGFAAIRPALLALLPDHLRRMIAGDTDSEHAFALFLEILREEGHLDDLDVGADVVGRALARTVRKIDELARAAGVQRPSTLNLVATNGRLLAATRRGRPLFYALLEGILPCERHGLHPGAKDADIDPSFAAHRRVKAVCFATLLRQPNGFIEVPDGSLVYVSRSLQVHVASLASQ
jgi:predicted glutamine amidotransferase